MLDNSNNEVGPLLMENDKGLLTLTLNRPHAANALSPSLVESIIDALTTIEGTRLCVIRGTGRHFCAGFDLSDLENLTDGDLLWRFLRIETMLQAVHYAPFPVIALAQGQIVGAGADLFAACWQRIVTSDAKLKMPGWNFELALGTRRLARLIGQDAARDLLIDTKRLSSQQCLDCNLATAIKEQEEWKQHIEACHLRSLALPVQALNDLFSLSNQDTRSEDLASIVPDRVAPVCKTGFYPIVTNSKKTLDPRSISAEHFRIHDWKLPADFSHSKSSNHLIRLSGGTKA